MIVRGFDPYKFGARFYDWFSGERFVYRAGRIVGIDLLRLKRGDVVLDVGCGTGLNFSPLRDAVGSEGLVIGLDSSPHMLNVAQRRIQRRSFDNVHLIEGDAMDFPPSCVDDVLADHGRKPGVSAVFASYTLSVVKDWQQAWSSSMAVIAPGGRVGVVDMQLPTGTVSLLKPLAYLACWMGGSDIHAHPWTAVERDCGEVEETTVRGGHIVVATGTYPVSAAKRRQSPGDTL